MGNAAREVHRINLPNWRNAKHGAQFLSTLETSVFPVFGDLPSDQVQSHHILAALQPIWLGKQETARRVRQRIGKVLDWVVAQSWRADNPISWVDAALPKQKHAVTARVLDILREAKDVCDGSDLVFAGSKFAGSKYGRPMSDATLLKLVRSLGFAVDMHGFRSSFRTWAAEQTDTPREVAEHALAHAVGSKVERAYNRSDLFERRRALMDDWAAYCRKTEGV